MDWIDLAQNRDRWWALVNTVMSLHVPLNVGQFFRDERLAVSEEGLSSMEMELVG
jgi:hypothetical protein